jgi:hypothetical protein
MTVRTAGDEVARRDGAAHLTADRVPTVGTSSPPSWR